MALSSEMLKRLIRVTFVNREAAIDCDACLCQIDQFAERVLADKEVSEALILVQEHLEVCTECREEYEALLAALRGLKEAEERGLR